MNRKIAGVAITVTADRKLTPGGHPNSPIDGHFKIPQ